MSLFKNDEYNLILNNLQTTNNACLICRDEIKLDVINLSCGHTFHSQCLLDSFIKYSKKTCPYCDEYIILDSYKKKCKAKMSNNKLCEKICYNNDSLCKRHLKCFETKSLKINNKINILKSKANAHAQKINEINKEIKKLQSELK